MTPKLKYLLALGLLLNCGGRRSPPFLPNTAPERKVAGCYSIRIDDSATTFPIGSAIDQDTIHLTLDGITRGYVTGEVGEDLERPVDWRRAGYMLQIVPDLYGGLHSYGHWQVETGDTLRILGGGGLPSYEIRAVRTQAATWNGTIRRLNKQRVSSMATARLQRSPCPDSAYFNSLVVRRAR